MRSANASAAFTNSCGATTEETSPMASACVASTMSPVSAISAARDMPIVRGSSQHPPSPEMMPSLTKLSAKRALLAAMRISHMHAKSLPAPTAAPLTAAMMGTCKV